jgi:putative transcriptional regulator
MAAESRSSSGLTGMMLVAMPHMPDERFARSVIFLCSHSEDGAMGLIVNRVVEQLRLPAVLGQLGIEWKAGDEDDLPVHLGGPVEGSRGFVLHSSDYAQESTLVIDTTYSLTANIDVLKAIAAGQGPRRKVLALGYAGWAPGQLDAEIQGNGWLVMPADPEIVFGPDDDTKWSRALAKLKVDPSLLSSQAGHA